MINADEHKKLLEQITELEKNSINYFDVEKEFFLIDSDNLSQARSKLYGYSIQRSGIYENDDLTPEAIAGLDGRGCYVYVEVKDGQITIKQDLNGCWGIYLFRHGDYFAISNSFFRLLDHVKFKYPLTVNRDYCHHMITNGFLGFPCFETVVNEIRLLERNAIVLIDIADKTFQIEMINYKEFTLTLDSEEGIATLDRWVDFWSNVLRGVVQHAKFIQTDLSGGFDSRVAFLFALNSKLSSDQIFVNSIKSKSHTYPEDYEIATRIVAHYGLKLNPPLPKNQALNYSLSDIWKIDLYHRKTFHKLPDFYISQKYVDKVYSLNGYSGETLRGRFMESPQEFLARQIRFSPRYSRNLSLELVKSSETIFKSGFRFTYDKYNLKDTNSTHIPQLMYMDTWSRNHFGKISVGDYFKNIIKLSPALDPEVRTLFPGTQKCSDAKLLIALLFARYAPDLLTFPFDSNRFIAPETIEYARKLNERFPRLMTTDKVDRGGVFYLQPRDLQTEKLSQEKNNKKLPNGIFKRCLEAEFYSTKTFGTFCTYFDEELYHDAFSAYANNVFSSIGRLYMISGIAKVVENVEISQRNYSPYRDMTRFLEGDFAQIHDDARIYSQVIDKFSRYITATVMVRLYQNANPEALQIVSVSDSKASISKIEYHQKDGVCYSIRSYIGNLEIVAKALEDGQVRIYLSAPFVTEPGNSSKHIPYYIDYTNLTVNNKVVFNELKPIWHDKGFRYILDDVKAGEEFTIKVEWQPHRSDT